MDDQQLLANSPAQMYRCPGDSHDIDRATHLGRLASFFPACRQCVHRTDVVELGALPARRWAQVLSRPKAAPRFTAEGLDSDSPNAIGPEVVRRLGAALGTFLAGGRSGDPRPAVLVGADGSWTTAELISTACDALQLAGCRAIEAGALAMAPLALAAHRHETDAGLWIGNATGGPHAIALRLFGRAGRPWSSPGDLDRLRELYDSTCHRPTRRGGGLERAGSDEIYLAPLASLFHALRPLRFVVDTTCEPLLRHLRFLASQAACEVLRPTQLPIAPAATTDGGEASFLERRLSVLGQQVVLGQAHFGWWIDGGGASCRLVDERGAPVDSQRLCQLLAAYICREKPGATIALEPESSDPLHRALENLGARVVRGAATRQATCAAIESACAVFAGGPSGTFWFAGQPPAPDALLATGLLLTILSQSDRPVSEVLDAA